MSEFNVADSLVQGSDMPTNVGLLLAHGNNFGRMSFLPPPMTHMGIPAGTEPSLAVRKFSTLPLSHGCSGLQLFITLQQFQHSAVHKCYRETDRQTDRQKCH